MGLDLGWGNGAAELSLVKGEGVMLRRERGKGGEGNRGRTRIRVCIRKEVGELDWAAMMGWA